MQSRYITALLLAALALGHAGCRKDLGNYDYVETNVVDIQGINNDYEFRIGDTVRIIPEIHVSMQGKEDPDLYNYRWTTYEHGGTSDSTVRVVSRRRNLDTVLPLKTGSYTLAYEVQEKSSGITAFRQVSMKVSGSFKLAGWFVLNDGGANPPRLDYYEDDINTQLHSYPRVYRDLTGYVRDAVTGIPFTLTGKPLFVQTWQSRFIDISGGAARNFVYIGTTDKTQKINMTEGFTWNAITHDFRNETSLGDSPALARNFYPYTASISYIEQSGNLFYFNGTYRQRYGVPLNQLLSGETFKIAEQMAVPVSNDVQSACLMFDKDNRRFLKHSGLFTYYATTLPANSDPGGFDPSVINRDLVWMGYTFAYTGQAVAVLKDGAGKMALARMAFSPIGAFKATSLEDINPPEIDKATKFALDSRLGYLFYAVGGKLYQYDMDTKVAKVAKDYGSREITLLKASRTIRFTPLDLGRFPQYLARYESPVYGLCVGTCNPGAAAGTGQLDVMKVPTLMGEVTPFYSFSGLDRIVDVCYNEF